MEIENLVETMWLVRYPWLFDITHDQGRYFIGHRFKNSFIEEEYSIKTKPASPRNPKKRKPQREIIKY